MKIVKVINLSLLVFFCVACKKHFKHKIKVNSTTSTCTYCLSADSINGQYRGLATGLNVPNNSDSLTVQLEHIFLNLGNNVDSNEMFFRINSSYDSNPNSSFDTIKLDFVSGQFEKHVNNGGSHSDFNVNPDSLHIHAWAYYWQTGFYGDYLIFHGKKIP